MKYRLAIFDFDGTLADSLPRMLSIFNRLADQYRFKPIADEEIETIRTMEMRQVLKHLRIPFWKLPSVLHTLRQQMKTETDQIGLFPGIDEFLARLVNQGVRLAIVSSNSWDNIQRILGPQNSKLFEFTECSASIFGKRPKLRKVIRNSGVALAQSIYVGDELRDLIAARAEGLAFGAVTWGYAPATLLVPHHPQELFETVTDMGDKLIQPIDSSIVESPLAKLKN